MINNGIINVYYTNLLKKKESAWIIDEGLVRMFKIYQKIYNLNGLV